MRTGLCPCALTVAAGITILVILDRLNSESAHAVEPIVVEDIIFDSESDNESSPSDLVKPYFIPSEHVARKQENAPSLAPTTIVEPETPPSLAVSDQHRHQCCTSQIHSAQNAMRDAYRCLFFENDFRYLSDPCYRGTFYPGDGFKNLAQKRLDFGGEARIRFQADRNIAGSGLSGANDDYVLTRVRLYSDYQFNDWFRIYAEYLHGSNSTDFLPEMSENPSLDRVQNAFLDTQLTETLSVRIGRQEQSYGSQRLISPLDWVNDRRTFDGVKAMHQGDRWQTNIFYLNPVGNSLSGTDLNEADRQIDFYGLFATRPVSKHMSIDAYYLGLNNNREQFEYQTIGSRVFGETDSGHLYALEGAYQFGSNSPGYGNHNAAFMTAGMGHRLGRFCPQQTGEARLWLWYDWASGDDEIPAARGDNGFDALFPQSHWYLGFMDLFGRRNINDISIQFSTPILSSKLQFVLWYHYFFLDQKTTPYNTDMTAFNPDHAAADRHLGQELDILFNLRVNPRNELLLGYSFFKSGKYYQLTPGSPSDADGQFLYLQYQTRF